ncbi:hypothetical protein N9448_03410 [Litorivicinus sp.]|nr:hypothetical protein [Litorivicinus sp.]
MKGARQVIGLSIFWLAEALIAADSKIDSWKIAEELGPMTEQELNGMTAIERATTPSTAYVFKKGLDDAVKQDSVKFRDVDGEELVTLGYLIGVARRCDASGEEFVSTAVENLESEISRLATAGFGKVVKS